MTNDLTLGVVDVLGGDVSVLGGAVLHSVDVPAGQSVDQGEVPKKIVERSGKIFPSLTCLSDCPDVPGSVLAFFCTEHSKE